MECGSNGVLSSPAHRPANCRWPRSQARPVAFSGAEPIQRGGAPKRLEFKVGFDPMGSMWRRSHTPGGAMIADELQHPFGSRVTRRSQFRHDTAVIPVHGLDERSFDAFLVQ